MRIFATGGANAFSMIAGTKQSNQPTDELPPDGKEMLASLERYTATYIKDSLSHKLIDAVLNASLPDEIRAQRVADLIKQGADVNYRQPNRQSGNDAHPAVLIASREGYAKTVKVFLFVFI